MLRKGKTQFKFKTYKSDAAPFFFYIDVFPLESNNFEKPLFTHLIRQIQNNPIMPLPMRVDKVFNGEYSIIIRPKDPIIFPISDDNIAIINPVPFVQLGLEKLLYFTEIRSRETLFYSLKQKAVEQWWNSTKSLYGNLSQLEEDFSAFLRAYLHTVVKALINEEDLVEAATEYCMIINDICKERMLRNTILVEINNKQKQQKIFKEKERKYREKLKIVEKIEYHPELVDIEVFNFADKDFLNFGTSEDLIKEEYNKDNISVKKYIPLLLYDDLQECMLQNLKLLETNEQKLLDPTNLLDLNIILLKKKQELSEKEIKQDFSWLNCLNDVNIMSIFNALNRSLD